MINSTPEIWKDLDEEVLIEDHAGEVSEIIVYNDDVNTFDWVIECFVDVCKHTFEQAEQLTLMVHFNGKASVKRGAFDTLRPMKECLCERGLSAVIEKIKV